MPSETTAQMMRSGIFHREPSLFGIRRMRAMHGRESATAARENRTICVVAETWTSAATSFAPKRSCDFVTSRSGLRKELQPARTVMATKKRILIQKNSGL